MLISDIKPDFASENSRNFVIKKHNGRISSENLKYSSTKLLLW